MSEGTLQQLLDRLNTDEAFRDTLKENPEAALAELDGLSPAEQAALASNDEDALRRLVCADVQGFGASQWGTLLCNIKSEIICWTANCPVHTPGSRKHCGTRGYCTVASARQRPGGSGRKRVAR